MTHTQSVKKSKSKSVFRKLIEGAPVCSSSLNLKDNHQLEQIEVLKGLYHVSNYETEIKTLVNLGTYFKYTTSTNFFVSLKDYFKFTEEYSESDRFKFLQDHNTIQEKNKGSEDQVAFKYDVYCSSLLCNVTKRKVVMPVCNYRTNPCNSKKGKAFNYVFHTELNDIYNSATTNWFYKENIKTVRYLQTGSENSLLTCKLTGRQVENVQIQMQGKDPFVKQCDFELHHINVVNGVSVRKTGIDPSKLLKTIILTEDSDKLIDIIGTVCLSRDSHSNVHSWPCTDITNYTVDQLPWCLQNHNNFNRVCEKYNLNLKYHEFIWSLSNCSIKKGSSIKININI